MPSMLTSVVLLVSQVRVVDWPFSMVLGLAVSEAVGAAGGGGGGGGGGATFFLQAPNVMMALNANTSMIQFNLFCFNFSSLRNYAPRLSSRGSSPGQAGSNLPSCSGHEWTRMRSLVRKLFPAPVRLRITAGCR